MLWLGRFITVTAMATVSVAVNVSYGLGDGWLGTEKGLGGIG